IVDFFYSVSKANAVSGTVDLRLELYLFQQYYFYRLSNDSVSLPLQNFVYHLFHAQILFN
ncbi:MAG: hypothetical protein VX798_13290, partial [Bacteroidota bacterium]|nr:hypothetical protein [Bacteroidota bacterium]